jgi:hypothetical protein
MRWTSENEINLTNYYIQVSLLAFKLKARVEVFDDNVHDGIVCLGILQLPVSLKLER